ncbi:MAG TPA: von Willebrand factor type A domain-containing protein, partial [Thermoanaerobaculia bacterium]|nr:von Willebrand factor type A domain-containing protein [Thermoanaerobaculia bacterium]
VAADRTGAVEAMVQLLPEASRPGPVVVVVRDEREELPLPGATLVIDAGGHRLRRVTGADGRAEVLLPPGSHRVQAFLDGFASLSTTVAVPAKAGSPTAVELTLPLASVAEEIVVTGGAEAIAVTGEPVTVVGEAPVISTQAVTGATVASGRRFRRVPAPEAPLRAAAPPPGGAVEPDDAPYRDMRFRHYGVHPFVDTADDRLSTFGLDVDTGSWGLVASYLEDGHLPPAEAVRVEEVVNALDYGDPAPERGETFRVAAEGAPTPFAPGSAYRLLRFGLRARSIDPAARRPATLVFVIDTSGSMEQGGRLELVKDALGLLLDQLGEGDRVAVVAFSDGAQVVLPATGDRAAARRAIAELQPDGSTNAEAGLALGYRLAWEAKRPGTTTRVLLLSDGVANVGATVAESILARAAGAAADGIELSTFGVGMGNYDDVLLEQLADRGDGRYAYVDDVETAHRLFVAELAGTLETVAEEARVQVEFDPRAVERWRLLGYENRDLEDRRFRHDHAVDAGEIGAGHTVTALYEVLLAPGLGSEQAIAHLTLRYREPESGRFRESERLLRVADLAATWEEAPRALRLAAVAAELAEQLRGSRWATGGDPADLARHARAVAADFSGNERAAHLARLAALASRLATAGSRPGEE